MLSTPSRSGTMRRMGRVFSAPREMALTSTRLSMATTTCSSASRRCSVMSLCVGGREIMESG